MERLKKEWFTGCKMEQNRLIYAALDYDSQKENLAYAGNLVQGVDSDKYGFKINLDSVAHFSSSAANPYSHVKQVMSLGKPVFVDLKMWNGGRTMENVAKGCADLGVSIINMYAHAGRKFVERVKRSLEGSNTKLFTLTVLTHYTDSDAQEIYGCSLSEAVQRLAKIGIEGGADGLILPGNQLEYFRSSPLEKLCPAIRPLWFEDTKANDQEQTITPYEAVSGGADIIVVGSPIRRSKSPSEALIKIIEEIAS